MKSESTQKMNAKKRRIYRFGMRRGAWLTLCLALMLTAWMTLGAQRACAISCYIDAQPEQTSVGQSVTVTVVFSGDDVGRVRATLEYDQSVLSYQGEGGDTGEVSLYMAGSGNGISYSLPFKAVGAGDCMLLMTPLDAYDMDEMSIALPESQSMVVSVEGPDEPAEPEPEPEKPDEPDVQDDPVDEPVAPEQPQEEPQPEEPEQKTGISPTVWVLAGLALLAALLLIAVLLSGPRRRE